jgi:hypothetical protein
MRGLRRGFSPSNASCERRGIDDGPRRESQVDVFAAVILTLRAASSWDHLAASVALALAVLVFAAFVFAAAASSLRARIWGGSETAESAMACVPLALSARRLEMIIEDKRVERRDEGES